MLLVGKKYSRRELRHLYGESDARGGNWDTGYVEKGGQLLAFVNVGTPGRVGPDLPNKFNEETGELVWHSKPGRNSSQPQLQRIINGTLVSHFFLRWNNDNPKFLYIGQGRVSSFTDGVVLASGDTVTRMNISFDVSEHHAPSPEASMPTRNFNRSVRVSINRYERNPILRQQCLDHFGYDCQICNFSFSECYGELGEEFCHVHHIEPLSQTGGEGNLDPIKDLIPVCPNCHAMLHRKTETITPDELREILALEGETND